MELLPKTPLQGGKYKIIEKIGQGGFGIAYKAKQVSLDKNVCIKEFYFSDLCERKPNSSDITIISTSSEKIQLVNSLKKKFIKEALRLAKFQHPNIVQVTDNFEENNTAYFVMEFLDGGSLDDLIRKDGAMSEQKAKVLILPIIDAMDTVHKKDLLHLDIKPANIMLRKNQSPVLIDFGISKYMEIENANQNTITTAAIGYSNGFSPIEQGPGSTISDFTKATDIYSLCATLYKMVTGVTPLTPLQMITSGFKSPRDLRPQLTADFNAAILKGLSTKAADRPQTMVQLKMSLVETHSNNQTIIEAVSQTVVEISEPVLGTAVAYFERARGKQKSNKYKEAIDDYGEAIKKNSKNSDYYFYRAVCYHDLANYNKAIVDYSKVIELNPKEVSAYSNRGLCYEKLRNNINASNDLLQVYKLSTSTIYFDSWIKTNNIEVLNICLEGDLPNKDKMYYIRGEIYLNNKNYIKACEDFFKSYKLTNNKTNLDKWISIKNMEILNLYLERNLPNKDIALYNRGILLINSGEKDKGLKDITIAKKLGNKDAINYLKPEQPSLQLIFNVSMVFLLNTIMVFLILNSDLSLISATRPIGDIHGSVIFCFFIAWVDALNLTFNPDKEDDGIYDGKLSTSFRYFAKGNTIFTIILSIGTFILIASWSFSINLFLGILILTCLLFSIFTLIKLWTRS